MNPWPALSRAGLSAGQSVRTRGVRRTALVAALGLGLPALAEAYAVTLRRELRHHMQSQPKGVPLNAILGWYTITYAVPSALLGPVSAAPGPCANGSRTREQLMRLCSTGSTVDDYWGGLWRDEWAGQ
jgi:hypothetical protein